MSLRDLDAHAKAIDTCVYCPKLCRFACPVAEAEARETVTPWGLMTQLDDVRRGRAPLDETTAELFAHCTGCRRCEAVCKHSNPVADVVRAARALAVQVEVAPMALDAWARPKPAPGRLQRQPIGGPVQMLVGDADDEVVEAAIALLAEAGIEVGRPDGVTHSGVRALEAGRPGAYRVAVDAVQAALFGADLVVCLEAEDVLGLRRARDGAGVREGKVVHWLELVSELPLRAAISGDVLYLDDCRLAHGLGVHEEPRALLTQVVRGRVVDALMSGAEAGCCGAGAGYAACAPDGAVRVAEDAVAIAPGLPVVTASARCLAHLRQAVPERRAQHLVVALAAGALAKEKS